MIREKQNIWDGASPNECTTNIPAPEGVIMLKIGSIYTW